MKIYMHDETLRSNNHCFLKYLCSKAASQGQLAPSVSGPPHLQMAAVGAKAVPQQGQHLKRSPEINLAQSKQVSYFTC